jgi:hypothetical protein
MVKKINVEDIEAVLGKRLPFMARESWETLEYIELEAGDRDRYILDILNVLDGDVLAAGEHRRKDWEMGWHENFKLFFNDGLRSSLVPRYYGKYPIVRWKGDFVMVNSDCYEYRMIKFLVKWAVEKYMSRAQTIYELGCGTGDNLLTINDIYPHKILFGFDWAESSQSIIYEINKRWHMGIRAHNFDFYAPKYIPEFYPNSGVLTVAALEQIGDKFEPLLQFLLHKRPNICVHLEPIEELLDSNNLLDNLSIRYFRKRNYLRGFLTRLRQLRDEGKIEIIKEQRTYTGSYYIEGHSLIVWRPL